MNLTRRETEIVREAALGIGRREIAHKYGITYKTVDAHLTNAKGKLGAHNQAALLAIALRNGIIDWEDLPSTGRAC